MLKIKNKILTNQRVYKVFQEIMESKLSFDAAYKMKRYADKLDQKQKDHVQYMAELLKLHGATDASGNYILEYQGEGEEKVPVGYKLKNPDEFNKVIDTYLNDDFEIEVNPLYAVELKELKISPNDLTIIEPFIADLNNL